MVRLLVLLARVLGLLFIVLASLEVVADYLHWIGVVACLPLGMLPAVPLALGLLAAHHLWGEMALLTVESAFVAALWCVKR